MIGRKGTTDTLSFLIGVIIFLLIVIPIGIAVYHYMFAQSGMQKTLDLLIERTSDLEDGQKDSIIGYIDNGYILISFEKDQAQFGSTETTFGVKRWTCKGVGDETFTMYWGIKKPSRCGNKACLCACGESGKDIPWVGDWLDLAGPNLCSDGQCVVYDDDKSPRFYGGANCEYGVFIAPGSPTLELNFEKQGQITGICEELPCISQEVSKARDTYNELMEKYDKCKKYNAEDCICEATSIQNMPIDHAIKFVSDGRITTTGFYDEEGQKRTEVSFEDKPFGIYDPVKDEGKQVTSVEIKSSTVRDYWFFETEIDSGPFNYEGKDNIYLYKAKGGFVSFVAGNPNSIKEDKEYCWIKAGIAAKPGEEGSTCKMTSPISSFDAIGNELFGRESTPTIIAGSCKTTCNEDEFKLGRKGQYCPTLNCCVSNPDTDGKCGFFYTGICRSECNRDETESYFFPDNCLETSTKCCRKMVDPETVICGEDSNIGICKTECNVLAGDTPLTWLDNNCESKGMANAKCCMLFEPDNEVRTGNCGGGVGTGICKAGCDTQNAENAIDVSPMGFSSVSMLLNPNSVTNAISFECQQKDTSKPICCHRSFPLDSEQCRNAGGGCKGGCNGYTDIYFSNIDCGAGWGCCVPKCAAANGQCKLNCAGTEIWDKNINCGALTKCCTQPVEEGDECGIFTDAVCRKTCNRDETEDSLSSICKSSDLKCCEKKEQDTAIPLGTG